MSLRTIVLLMSISMGASLGWRFCSFGGILGSYLSSVLGAAIGLVLGRKIQRFLDGE